MFVSVLKCINLPLMLYQLDLKENISNVNDDVL